MKDASLEPSPVWMDQNGVLEPRIFFRNWFEQVAEKRFGDRERWWEAAVELGYIAEWTDSYGQFQVEYWGFEHDHVLYRASLGRPQGLPLISELSGNCDRYDRMWDRLLGEKEPK
jgi:hypothetical protein